MNTVRAVYQGEVLIAYDASSGKGRWVMGSGDAFPTYSSGSGFPRPHDGALFFRSDLDAWYTWDEVGAAWVISGGAGGPHASTHEDGGGDEIDVTGLSGLLADAQTPLPHSHVEGDVAALVADLSAKVASTRTISTTAPLTGGGDLSANRTFGVDDFVASGAGHARGTVPDPGAVGGTTKFLREDASWQVPPAGGSTPSGTGFRHVTAGVEDAASKLVDTADINNNQVTPAKLDDGSGFSVLGKATTGAGDRADIVAADETVLGRTAAGNLAFAALATGQIAAKAVTYAKIQDVSATDRLLGRDSAGAGVVEEITVAAALSMLGAFSSIAVQVFTATGANTYTPTSGMKYCLVISTGAGGGGGGADTSAGGSGDVSVGGGGGAGGTCIEAFSAAAIGASQTVTIGTGGTAGTNTGGSGGNGGNTTFGALHTANGGNGGTGGGSSAQDIQTVAGGTGGVPSGGTANIAGGDGQGGFATANDQTTSDYTMGVGGAGGASFWGGGAKSTPISQLSLTTDLTAAGAAGVAPGSGGAGAVDLTSTTGAAGGAGANGYCLVLEFV